MRRPIAALASTILLSACGARTSLDEVSTSGEGGGAATSTGGGGAGGQGGTGGVGGGVPFVCPQLTWAGAPVVVDLPFGNSVATPRLVATGDGDYGLVFDAITDSVGHTIGSFPIHQPFESWPPITGAADLNLPTPNRYAVSTGDPTMFAFSAVDGSSNIVLGEALPGQNGSTVVTFPNGDHGVHALSRNGGAYLALEGSDDVVSALGFPAFVPDIPPTDLGLLGCATPVAAAAIPLGPDFVVASAVDQPFDGCVDPDLPGPPLYVQIHRIGSSSGVTPGSFISFDAPIDELELAPSATGAWLGTRAAGTGEFDVRTVDATTLAMSEPVDHLVSARTSGRHALTGAGPTFALATVEPSDAAPGGEILLVDVFVSFNQVEVDSLSLALVPSGEPTIVASEDGRSLLVAVSAGPSSVALLRADCAD